MAQNHIIKGEVLPLTNSSGSDIASGDVVVMGDTVGVALGNIADTERGSAAVEEVFEIPKNTSTAFAQGENVYWDVADTEANDDDVNNPKAGIAYIAATSAATTVQVKLGR